MIEILADLVGGFAIAFCVLLALAIVHKLRVLIEGDPSSEPLLQVTEWRRAHATPLLVSATLVEVVIAIALLAAPVAGFSALSVLVVVYARLLSQLPETSPCACFGEVLRGVSRRAEIGRNLLISGIGIGSAGILLSGAVDGVALTEGSVGVALLLASGIGSLELFRRVVSEPAAKRRLTDA